MNKKCAAALLLGLIAHSPSINSQERSAGGFKNHQAEENDREFDPNTVYVQAIIGIDRSVSTNWANSDPRRKRTVARDLLRALGITQGGARRIVLTAQVVSGGVDFPLIPLATYTIDPAKNSVAISDINEYTSPLHLLGPADGITVKLSFADTTAQAFDLSSFADSISDLAPGSAIVNSLSTPLFGKLSETTSAVLTSLNSQNFTHSSENRLSLRQGGTIRYSVDVNDTSGLPFSKVNVELAGTKTLLKDPIPLSGQNVDALFRPLTSRENDYGSIRLLNGATRENAVSRVLSQVSPRKLIENKSLSGNIRDFCRDSQAYVRNHLRLAEGDMLGITYQTMIELGFPTSNEESFQWLTSCFPSGSDYQFVTNSFGLAPTPPPSPDRNAHQLSNQVKRDFACLLAKTERPNCASRQATILKLSANLTEDIDVQAPPILIDLSDVSDPRFVPKADFLSKISGIAEGIRCAGGSNSLILTVGDATYRFETSGPSQRAIDRISFRPVPITARDCNE